MQTSVTNFCHPSSSTTTSSNFCQLGVHSIYQQFFINENGQSPHICHAFFGISESLHPFQFRLPFANIEKRVGRFSQSYFISSSFMIAKCPFKFQLKSLSFTNFRSFLSSFVCVFGLPLYRKTKFHIFLASHASIITITPHATSISTCYENFLMVLMDLMKDKK